MRVGNPLLRSSAKSVPVEALSSDFLQYLIKQMIATMRKAKGVGLAANQIGSPLNVMVLECKKNPRYPTGYDFPLKVYLNLKILKLSRKKILGWEGCLSIPGYRGAVHRSESVLIKAQLPNGTWVQEKASGFEARVIQHEADHLSGKLYIDHLTLQKDWMHLDLFNQKFRKKIKDHAKNN